MAIAKYFVTTLSSEFVSSVILYNVSYSVQRVMENMAFSEGDKGSPKHKEHKAQVGVVRTSLNWSGWMNQLSIMQSQHVMFIHYLCVYVFWSHYNDDFSHQFDLSDTIDQFISNYGTSIFIICVCTILILQNLYIEDTCSSPSPILILQNLYIGDTCSSPSPILILQNLYIEDTCSSPSPILILQNFYIGDTCSSPILILQNLYIEDTLILRTVSKVPQCPLQNSSAVDNVTSKLRTILMYFLKLDFVISCAFLFYLILATEEFPCLCYEGFW